MDGDLWAHSLRITTYEDHVDVTDLHLSSNFHPRFVICKDYLSGKGKSPKEAGIGILFVRSIRISAVSWVR
ncbi:hypothetical protein BC936DRAFT_147823 [Jimgerdemannia flammicorona]|uniref:Uncharacterized protein n=1 Tax=Jimgerdemannia flammicorona TaxID=994334 RepID=A0A433D4F8_9FUNG|nr:hypothetical protein BC936DRAFT_147823 [Jimgerdemannia flammicorona]